MDINLKRELMIENFEKPFHKEIKEEREYIKSNSYNASCIDNIDLFVKIQDGKIKDAYFDGEACAITISATSLMLKKIIGMSLLEAKEFILEYYNMVNQKPFNQEKLGNLLIYSDIARQASRKKCALLPVETLEKSLKNYEEGEKID